MNEVTTGSTLAGWIVIILFLIVMASFWNALLNFGQSNPVPSTILVVLIAGLGWWFLIVKGPKAEAQTQPKPTPAIQQSIGSVAGGSTVNQAGHDIIINQGVSEDTIRQLISRAAASEYTQLTERYPKGFVLLGVANGKIVYFSDNAPKNLKINWELASIKNSAKAGYLIVKIPDISIDDSEMSGCSVEVERFSRNPLGLAKMYGHRLYFEVLDSDKSVFVIGMK